jgi:predicted aldo/keto reductase-like oxidoreductase
MSEVRLGRTEICVNKNGFGALPVQRVSLEEAAYLLKKAYQGGIRFFDTARAYSDSEEKIGYALSDVRKTLFISSKTTALTAEQFWKDLQTSLTKLKTDYLDILQFHNPPFCPKPGDESGLYDAILEARDKGMVRFVGFTNHRLAVAQEAVESGLYDTLQFPFSYLADEKEVELVKLCEKKDVGFIAMKALSGGLITNSAAAYAYLDQYPNVLPIWGVQRESELDEFLSYINCPPALTQELKDVIDRDRSELVGDFCRGCGYCLPCPAEIDIPTCARMSLLLRRAPAAQFLTEESRQKMARIENCIHCGHCESHCPYGLKTPELLRKNYEDYKSFF